MSFSSSCCKGAAVLVLALLAATTGTRVSASPTATAERESISILYIPLISVEGGTRNRRAVIKRESDLSYLRRSILLKSFLRHPDFEFFVVRLNPSELSRETYRELCEGDRLSVATKMAELAQAHRADGAMGLWREESSKLVSAFYLPDRLELRGQRLGSIHLERRTFDSPSRFSQQWQAAVRRQVSLIRRGRRAIEQAAASAVGAEPPNLIYRVAVLSWFDGHTRAPLDSAETDLLNTVVEGAVKDYRVRTSSEAVASVSIGEIEQSYSRRVIDVFFDSSVPQERKMDWYFEDLLLPLGLDYLLFGVMLDQRNDGYHVRLVGISIPDRTMRAESFKYPSKDEVIVSAGRSKRITSSARADISRGVFRILAGN